MHSNQESTKGWTYLHPYYALHSESESALFAKCVQTHKEFVEVFRSSWILYIIGTYIIYDGNTLFKGVIIQSNYLIKYLVVAVVLT